MVDQFKGKRYIAVILGGSSGLGLAAAKKLAAAGMGLCLVYRSRQEEVRALQADWEELRAQTEVFLEFNADAGNPETIREVVQALQPYRGQVRCLLYSIAKGSVKAMVPDGPGVEGQGVDRQGSEGPVSDGQRRKNLRQNDLDQGSLRHDHLLQKELNRDELRRDDLQLTMEQMAFSLYDWVRVLAGQACFTADARVLAFTSEGSYRARKHYAAVSVAKAALEALVRSIALEFAPMGIRANCIQAGVTDTPGMRRIPGSSELLELSGKRNPFGRLTRAEDVADVVCLLCTDEAAWINGAVLPVDGGEHIV